MGENETGVANDAQQARDLVADLNDAIGRLVGTGVRVEVTVDEVNTFGQHPRPSLNVELWTRVLPGRMAAMAFDFTGFEAPEGWPEARPAGIQPPDPWPDPPEDEA